MQAQWPRAAFKQYQLQKPSTVDLMHAAVPCLPYPPPGDHGHGVARREGALVPRVVLPASPLGKRGAADSVQRNRAEPALAPGQVSLHRSDKNRAVLILFSKQNAASYISNQVRRINFPLAMLSC